MAPKKQTFAQLQADSFLSGGSTYLEDLYEDFLNSADAVEKDWHQYFSQVRNGNAEIAHGPVKAHFAALAMSPVRVSVAGSVDLEYRNKEVAVSGLVNAYRSYGHHHAKLDPINVSERMTVPDLQLSYYGFTDADLNTEFNTAGFAAFERATLKKLFDALNYCYAGSIGIEYMHISNSDEHRWLQQQLERKENDFNFTAETKKRIYSKLNAAEGLEKYMGSRYVGQKRFSLEGGDSLIPMLDDMIDEAGRKGVKEVVIGMAHRGRLNVVINIMGKPSAALFAEFEGKGQGVSDNGEEGNMSGDVKYHLGYSSDIKTAGGLVHQSLAFNPSHLEIINPVVGGSVRARQRRYQDSEREKIVPIIIHGDAAFAGQGVVMETFNMSQARGYRVGGTVHIVINNQVGFTTSNPLDSRSTLYCTDVAKMVQAPIIHVNGDDPEAVVFAARIAMDYRQKFKKDIVLDLVCYRRHGHNEADEPSATQPLMYKNIKNHPTTRDIYANTLIAQGLLTQQEVDQAIMDYRDLLDRGESTIKTYPHSDDVNFARDWNKCTQDSLNDAANTGIDAKLFNKIVDEISQLPDGFVLQPQVAREISNRTQMLKGEMPINWGAAETMAYATLLAQGYPVRISGQDSGRGTFAHRHAVLHDQNTGESYIPLKRLTKHIEDFVVIDSVLSEVAVLGYEYGYASAEPSSLTIWEAQFGDFANGAQVVIDQFISSGEQKWGRYCGLTLLLPHGYEGAGPEHSSARLERFLQLCAQHNIQVCVPSTPAQTFHMLRRQVIRPCRKPLVVMTPKSLLRHKLAVSELSDLTDGQFHLVIPEIDKMDNKKIKRVVMCSGKVYYDLLAARRDNAIDDVALIRIEQLYPFPHDELSAVLKDYQHVKDIVWCQEEPQNQGAWYSSQHNMWAVLSNKQTLHYAGRAPMAAPAVGYAKLHVLRQQKVIEDALGKKIF